MGLLGGTLVYVGLVLLGATAQPLFLTGDESAHVDYAREVSSGRIPVVESPMTTEFADVGQTGRRQYVSNHPPLYHLLISPLVRAAEASDHPRVFLLLARGLTAGLGLAILVTLVATAVTVLRHRPRERAIAAVVTLGVAGALPALVAGSSTIRNDVLNVLATAATVLVLAVAVRNGSQRWTVPLLALLATVGMLSRIAFLPVWLLAIGGAAALALWPRLRWRRPAAVDMRRALLHGALVVLLPLLGAGWFYALSLRRYGDLTGGSAVYPWVADRTYAPGAEDGPLTYMALPSTWWAQVKQLGGGPASLAEDRHLIHPVLGVAIVGVLLLLVVGGAGRRRRLGGLLDHPARWTLTMLALVAAASYAELAVHVSHKGVDSQRYLLAAIGLWAVGSAILVVAGPRPLVPYAATLLTGLLAVGSVTTAVDTLGRRADPPEAGWFSTLAHGVQLTGFPAGNLVVAALLAIVAAGLVLQLLALRGLCTSPRGAAADPGPGPHAADGQALA